jgi:hypothetical protein
MLFLLYISFFLVIPEYLTDMCLLCADVGSMQPTKYARNKHHSHPGAAPAAARGPVVARDLPVKEAERVLRRVEWNFTMLTGMVPMAKIEDLPPSMKPHVVGAPQTLVWLFWHLANAVDQYNRAHMT